jgi:hypothetical protein
MLLLRTGSVDRDIAWAIAIFGLAGAGQWHPGGLSDASS